jgi:hypothetical protein
MIKMDLKDTFPQAGVVVYSTMPKARSGRGAGEQGGNESYSHFLHGYIDFCTSM